MRSGPDHPTASAPPVEESREAAIRERARVDAPPSAIRRWILDLAGEATRDWARAPDAIARGLRAARELSSAERRFVAEAVHEILRHRRRLGLLARGDDPGALL